MIYSQEGARMAEPTMPNSQKVPQNDGQGSGPGSAIVVVVGVVAIVSMIFGFLLGLLF